MAYTPPAGDKIRGRFASLDWVAPDGGQIRARFCGAWTRPRGDYVNAHFGFPGTFGDELVAHFGCRFICSEALDIIPLALAHAHTLSSSLLAELAQIQPQALTHGQTLSEGRLSFAILSYGLAHAQDLNAPAHEQTHILRTPGIEHFNDQFSFVEPLPAYRKPSRSRSAWAAPWDKPQAKPRPFLGPWDGQVKTDRPVRATHASPLPEDMALLSPWLALPEKDRPVRATHASPLPEDMALLSPWLDIQTKDRPVRATHASPLPEDATCLLPYTAPPPKDEPHAFGWDGMAPQDVLLAFPYDDPPAQDRPHLTVWGQAWYERICVRDYVRPPGDGLRVVFDLGLAHVGTGDHVDAFFDRFTYDERCSQQEPSGWRDRWPPVKPLEITTRFVPIRRAYFMLNQSWCCRLPDRTPFQAFDVALAIDLDSWGWSISGTVDAAAMTLLAVTTAPPEIEIQINGWTWTALITGWSESRQFPGGSYRIKGTSTSAALAKPWAPASTYTSDTVMAAQALAERELADTGWSLTWGLPGPLDWTVPAGAWSYQDLSPMEAVVRIVQAAGGCIQTAPSGKVLTALPRYPLSPWTWAGASPDISMTEDPVLALDREWAPGPCSDGVWVRGAAQGVQALVKRAGTAGANQAPMVTDSLITSTAAAISRGRMILAGAGKWSRYSVSLPLMASPSEPGLILPGSLVQVSAWKGQVSGISVKAARSNEGTTVRQTLEIERWHE